MVVMYLIIQSRYLFSDSCQSLKMWIFSTYHIFCRGLCVSTLHCLMNCLIWLFLTWFLFFVVVVVVVTWFFIWRENNQSNLYSFSMPPWLHRIASFFVSSSGLKSTSLCSYSSWGRCSVTLWVPSVSVQQKVQKGNSAAVHSLREWER